MIFVKNKKFFKENGQLTPFFSNENYFESLAIIVVSSHCQT